MCIYFSLCMCECVFKGALCTVQCWCRMLTKTEHRHDLDWLSWLCLTKKPSMKQKEIIFPDPLRRPMKHDSAQHNIIIDTPPPKKKKKKTSLIDFLHIFTSKNIYRKQLSYPSQPGCFLHLFFQFRNAGLIWCLRKSRCVGWKTL